MRHKPHHCKAKSAFEAAALAGLGLTEARRIPIPGGQL